MREITVTEMIISGDGHYIVAIVDGTEFKVKHENPCTWETRDTAFQELLKVVPEETIELVTKEYERYCEGLRNAEAEAERLANMTDEERLEMFRQQMIESFMREPEDIEYEEVHETIEA